MKKNYKSGQSLIEIVIAVALTAILAISLVSTMLVTQRTSQSARNNSEATKLAQEGLELMRVLRDRKGIGELTIGDCNTIEYSSGIGADDLVLYTANCPELIQIENVDFFRTIDIDNGAAANSKLVEVKINWDEQGGQKEVVHKTELSDWDKF